jgi:hypothetical protein
MERTIFRTLTGLGLVAVLFYFVINAINSVMNDVVESKYDWVAERFVLSINYIHKEWVLKGAPSSVDLTYYLNKTDTAKITVQLNQAGWPTNVSAAERELNCLNLWMLFAHEESHNQSIMDLTTELEIEQLNNECEFFHLDNGQRKLIFKYSALNGTITSAT